MKIVAYTALCYGSPYLKYAIESVIDVVDEYIVLYSEAGSHSGHRNIDKPTSEDRSRLHSIAYEAAQQKLRWIDGDWHFEGQQRDSIWKHTDADVVIVLDYDEVWPRSVLTKALWAAAENRANVLLPMIHFWRSFRWGVIDDGASPARVLLRGVEKQVQGHGKLLHFGYAIPDILMRYKWTIHGHIAELRQDINWFDDRWSPFSKEDVHPTNVNFWNPKMVWADMAMPDFLKTHPYYGKEMIE